DSLFVKLKPTAVLLSGVEKTAEIEATEIVKRAIERKADNLKILKTFKGTLYSKLVFEIGGSAFDAATGKDNSLVVSATIGKNKVDAKFQMFVLETFSNVMQDYEKKITRTNIIQRRQTSNMPASNNVLAIGNFINFYDDNMKFFNVDMITPLSKDALSYYKFNLLEKSVLDDRYIYVLEVLPNSDLFPLFQGTMKIVEGTYNLIELDLKPSKGTAIAFLRDIELNQKFTEVQKNIWHPTFLEAKGKAKVEVVKGFFELEMEVSATSIYSDVTVNEVLPDSVYSTEVTRKTTVEKTADSAKPEFWEKNSLREITPREIEMYKTVDSLVAKSDSIKANASDWDWGIMPAFDFNRVGSITAGITPSLTYKNIRLEGTGTFSFGLQKPLGEITLTVPIVDSGSFRLSAMGNVFSSI
ncbi:MAG: DUF5686 family protein, partial [Ignavibacteria bacterium]|nr:DUF5686 family protein [Ignavibacteria bacterium]